MYNKYKKKAGERGDALDSVSKKEVGGASVVALGFFDGLHRGHADLLDRACREAKARRLVPAVFSFHDGGGIKDGLPRLLTEEARVTGLLDAGMEVVHLADFAEVRDLSPAEFVEDILLRRCGAAAAVCGENFRFGRGASADTAALASLLATHGVPLFICPTRKYESEAVSTSAIRAAVEAGDMPRAAAMLGRPFSLTAPVLHGKELGRLLGFPTANQVFPQGSVIPACGVYAVTAEVEDGRRLQGVANVGRRPTVEGAGDINCETHFLDFTGDLYGKRLCLHFHRRLRGEKKFKSTEELCCAIRADREAVERIDLWNGQN